MRAANQLFCDHLFAPNSLKGQSTSAMISNGTFCYFSDTNAPFYLPLGQLVLEKVTALINSASKRRDIYQVTMPLLAKNEILDQGERIESGFATKIMALAQPMESYHLLFTPEPILHDLVKTKLLSHRQLPIRVCYHAEVFRAITDKMGLLKSRQFKTFIGNSIDGDLASVRQSMDLFCDLTNDIFSNLNIPTSLCERADGINREYYYFGSEGEDLSLPELGFTQKIEGLSLAMAYHYGPNHKFSARFQNVSNEKKRIMMTTYGLGVQRLFYAVFDACRDDFGFKLPDSVAPFRMALIPKQAGDLEFAEILYKDLQKREVDVLLDDRIRSSSGKRCAFADFIGVAQKVIIDKRICFLKVRGNDNINVINPDNLPYVGGAG